MTLLFFLPFSVCQLERILFPLHYTISECLVEESSVLTLNRNNGQT